MALLELADFSDALSLVYKQRITNNINRVCVLAQLIPVVQDEGKVCTWTTKLTGRSDAAGYTEGADMADGDFDNELRVPGSLAWGQYRKGAIVSGLASAAAATNYSAQSAGGPDIFGDEIKDATDRLARGIATDLYAGTGSSSHPLVGLAAAVKASSSYGTIDPGTYTEWVSFAQTTASASLSFSALRTFLTGIFNACGEPPTMLVTTPAIFDMIGDLFGSARRWVSEIQTVDAEGNAKTVKLHGGYQVLEFDGIPVIRDKFCTTGKLYALNVNYLKIRYLPAYNSPMSPDRFIEIVRGLTGERPPQELLDGMNAQSNGIPAFVDMLAKTGDATKAQVKAYLQLTTDRRNAHGVLTIS